MVMICGHVEEMNTENYVLETRKLAQILKKHHFQTSQIYQLVITIHYFKTTKEKYFSCGTDNLSGACGLGHFDSPQITPSLILNNTPSKIVHFVCGYDQNLFLDSEGNVFSVGDNYYGSLGLGHNTNQNELNKIPIIPPIKIISCARSS